MLSRAWRPWGVYLLLLKKTDSGYVLFLYIGLDTAVNKKVRAYIKNITVVYYAARI